HPHNCGDGMLLAKANLSSNRIFVWPKFPCEGLRDNGDWRVSFRIRSIKKPAFHQPDLHCRKVFGRGGPKLRPGPFSRLGRPVNGLHQDTLAEAAEWNVAGRTRRSYPGNTRRRARTSSPKVLFCESLMYFVLGSASCAVMT